MDEMIFKWEEEQVLISEETGVLHLDCTTTAEASYLTTHYICRVSFTMKEAKNLSWTLLPRFRSASHPRQLVHMSCFTHMT